MSPRPTSMSSSSSTVTDIGGRVLSTAPSGVSILAIREYSLRGRTTTSSPWRSTPPATRPA
jgi:hypothetical protein